MEEKPDDLEITSIGELYRGPWAKKYWSTSRGRDRYPYPVGYRAVRTRSGITFRMGISEGAKGPLFTVTSVGGGSCTGQTPDIAWENLQKKSGPRVKSWHGKRLSCKIDGTEFFGFRNPFVQRLLRELVANVNGMAERSLGPANFHNGALQLDSETLMHHTQRYPDLLPYLGRQQGTRKRSIISKDSIRSFSKEAKTKRICFGDSPNNAEGGTFEQVNRLLFYTRGNNRVKTKQQSMCLPEERSPAIQTAFYHPNCLQKSSTGVLNKITSGSPCQVDPKCSNDAVSTEIATSIEGIDGHEDLGSSFKVNVGTVAEENVTLANSKENKESKASACFLEKPFVYHKLHKANDREDYSLTVLEDRLLHEDKEQLGWLAVVKPENGDSLTAAEDTVGEVAVLSRFSDICIPDTCHDARDDPPDFASGGNKGSPCRVPEAITRYSKSTEDLLAGNMPSELISKSSTSSLQGMHHLPTETCTPLDTLSKGFIKDSLSELASSSDSPNPSSVSINLDLAGQELTRSMMTFLLPRAVPLLNKTYVKSRSRHRKLKNDCGPYSNVDGTNSVEGNVGNDCFAVFPSKDNFDAQTLAQKLEEKNSKELIIPDAVTGIDSLCGASKVEPPVINCQTNEPTAKDVKSIVPDSFVDEPQLCHVGVKESAGVAEDDAETSPANDRGGHNQYPACTSGDDRSNEEHMQSQGPGKNQTYWFASNAACTNATQITCLEQKSNDGCMNLVDKMSCGSHSDTSHPSCAKQDSPFSFDAEFLHIAEEEMLQYDGVLPCNSLKNHKDKNLQQGPSAPTPNKEFEVGALNTLSANCFSSYDSMEKTPPGCSPSDLVGVPVHSIDSMDTDGRSQQVSTYISQVALGGRTVVSRKDNSLSYVTNAPPCTGDLSYMMFKAGDLLLTPLTEKHHIPLARSTRCRSHKDDSDPKPCDTPSMSNTEEKDQPEIIGKYTVRKIPTTIEVSIGKKRYVPGSLENVTEPKSTILSVAAGVFENEGAVKSITEDLKTSSFVNPYISYSGGNCAGAASGLHVPLERKRNLSLRGSNHAIEALSCSDRGLLKLATDDCKNLSSQICQKNQLDELMSKKSNSNNKLGNHLDLVGCYMHPYPVLCIFLRSKNDHLQVCVLCGTFDEKGRNLFMYMVPTKGQIGSCPSFLGYTSLVLPVREDPFDGNISFERHVLQLTPEGQSLVFLNSIKAPHCSEQNINCLCSKCNSDPAEENGLEVANVKPGYVVTVTKLKTSERVSCILVCDPEFLVAAEVSGRLHVWIMNCTWSVNLEEFMLPNFDCISPAIRELQKIPKNDSVIIGHNGAGGFGLWDISKRILLSRFSSPGNTFCQIVPIRMASWQDKVTLASYQDCKKVTSLKINNCLLRAGENHFVPSTAEDIAVWLLVSTASDLEEQHDQVKKQNRSHSDWRLALLTNNMVIMGSVLDPRATAAYACSDYGIIGTCDGLLYTWELSTGEKLAILHSFKCGAVSQLTADAESGAIAAGKECQLLVYLPP